MSQLPRNDVSGVKTADRRWVELYKIGGITAIISAALIVFGVIAFFIWPYMPGYDSVQNIFALIQTNRFGGLMALDFILFLSNLLGILLFLALYVSLKRVNESYALIALTLGLVAAVSIIPARPIVELFSLSDLYTAAATEAVRSQYLAAGEALLTLFNGTAWMVNTFLGSISLLISALLMLRSDIFNKATAYIGILTNVATCGFFIPGGIGTALLFLTLPGYLAWDILLARSFLRLGSGKPDTSQVTS
jgi:hypothetical protein